MQKLGAKARSNRNIKCIVQSNNVSIEHEEVTVFKFKNYATKAET